MGAFDKFAKEMRKKETVKKDARCYLAESTTISTRVTGAEKVMLHALSGFYKQTPAFMLGHFLKLAVADIRSGMDEETTEEFMQYVMSGQHTDQELEVVFGLVRGAQGASNSTPTEADEGERFDGPILDTRK